MRFHTRFPPDLAGELEEAGLDVSEVVDLAMRGSRRTCPGDEDVDATSVATIPRRRRGVGEFNGPVSRRRRRAGHRRGGLRHRAGR